ncbi:BadF-type ATPase [Paenibacillus sp. UNC496MF]|uniref:N-acetylglucosamine kinase n=1 Tax=Paenibacillus sp. UNC496MF TaxID=1502753 RepID=UPI0008E13982|nr:BadF/BadG/BcrA/BcrD ATPase family protein [Paenibacillus sp. UNC496MF]SFJ01116.1 BadF-type ATPase [Paenibacillus sp. UNC496MF]
MDARYVIGVDGGNSKTDYFLFGLDGRFVDHLNAGTCSHERFPDGYDGAYRVMAEQLGKLLGRNGLTMADVAAGAFGLAGADVPSQKERLGRVVERLGFARYAVDNDSFLGVKAGSERGYGVCSINGSGTVAGGIAPDGSRLQIGGIGSELAGDEAGGFYLARRVLRAVYDALYRLGPATSMTEPVLALLEVPARERFMECAAEGSVKRTLPNTALMRILFAAADAGDEAAVAIVAHSAKQLAHSVAGCLAHLDFGDEPVDVVLAGSVWVKAESPLLLERFKRHVAELSPQRCSYTVLQVPPATGAVLWALELAHGRPAGADMRRAVIASVTGRP